MACGKCGIGVIPRRKLYRCTRCNEHVDEGEIETKMCPFCLSYIKFHKGCGGKVIEWSIMDVKMR